MMHPTRFAAGIAALLLGLAPACGESASRAGRPAQAALGGHVVGSVDGENIGVTELTRFAAAAELQPSEALQRLEEERLLAQEAARRGYTQTDHTARVARQALVQELLREAVEREEVAEPELQAAYTAQRSRFEQPEKRRSTHVLAELPRDAKPAEVAAARAYIEAAISQLQAAAGARDAVLERLRQARPATFSARVETLPASTADGPFVPEYLGALFSLPEPGVVPHPVRTEYGFHAIVVTEIIPAVSTPHEEALGVLRSELTTSKRKARLDAWLRDLRQRTTVHYVAEAEARLAQLEL